MTGVAPCCSVSLDLDNLWSYLNTRGLRGHSDYATYLPVLVPRVLDLLDELRLRITFFVVGADADRPENAALFRAIGDRGHDLGNHSYRHEPWLHRYTAGELRREVENAERAIERATGRRPLGFRGPGYSWSPTLLRILSERGYLYDASTWPTYLGPLARLYYFRTGGIAPEDRSTRAALFGTLRDGLRPIRPYRWQLDDGNSLLEIPVTTFPGVKTPIHLSYLMHLGGWSERLALTYLRAAVAACRVSGTEPSFLLHPTDLLDAVDAPELAFFPGMQLPLARKLRLFRSAVHVLSDRFALITMAEHARACLADRRVPTRRLEPASAPASIPPAATGAA